MKMEQSVPKRRHIKFRRRGITQKKVYCIQNRAKVRNNDELQVMYRKSYIVTTIKVRCPEGAGHTYDDGTISEVLLGKPDRRKKQEDEN